MDFRGRKRVSRLRAYVKGTKELALGKRLGETFTDTAAMTVCDIVALNKAIAGDHDGFNDKVMDHDFKDCGIVTFKLAGPVRLPYVATGFGDCSAPVFELMSNKKRVGIELEFLPLGFAYRDMEVEDEDADEEAPRRSRLRLGTPKRRDQVTLKDALARPIWVNIDGDLLHPVLTKTKNLTEAMLSDHDPIITFKVDGADLYGTGEYDDDSLSAIAFWNGRGWTASHRFKGLQCPLTLVSIPKKL